jgi:Glycosyl hydrolase family 10
MVRLRAALAATCFLVASSCVAQQISPSRALARDFFGMHIHTAGTGTIWPTVEFGSWRLWDSYVSWRDLEPEKGQWHFDALDRMVAMAEQHRIAVLLTLGSSPAWASARPHEPCAYGRGCAAEPERLEDWENYVRTVVSRYRGRIEAYELWNEVHFTELENPYDPTGKAFFYSGSCAKMVEMGRVAYRVIKELDPDAKLTSPSIHVQGDWIKKLRLYLRLGGHAYTDAISFHFYASSPEDTVRSISAVRAAMTDYGLGDKPLWNTETGFVIRDETEPQTRTGASPHDAAGLVARSFLLNAAGGVDRFYWYAWDDGIFGLARDHGQTPTEAALGYSAAQAWLTGARVRACSDRAGAFWSCELEKGKQRFWVVWSTQASSDWQPPNEWRVSRYWPLLAKRPLSIADVGGKIPVGPVPLLLESH